MRISALLLFATIISSCFFFGCSKDPLIEEPPTSNEISNTLNYLDENGLSDTSRDSIIQHLIITKPYYTRLFYINANEFLNGTDSLTLEYEVQLIQYLYFIDSVSGNTSNLIYYSYELNRLYTLQDLTNNYMNGSITMNEFYATFINNYFYDEVNMGTENFVKGSFDDLFRKAPTVE